MSGWHSQSAREVLAGLETDGQRGLTRQEAARRLERYGPNTLEQGKRRSMAPVSYTHLTLPTTSRV